MSNTGYIRATRFALKSINDGVETTTNFNIGDSFGNYLSVTTDTLLSMPVIDYENRISAFLLYVKGIYSGFTETTGVTNTSRFQSTNCSVEEPVLPPCYEYKLTCTGSIAEYFVIDCFGNGRYEKLDENEVIYICCTSIELTSGSGIFEINGACLTPTPTPTITEDSKLGVYDGMKNAYMYDGSNFIMDIDLPIYLINESNVQLNINSITLSGNFIYDLIPPISLSGFNESVLMNITYTGDVYSGETSTMVITTDDQILTYYIIREGHALPIDIGVINARNSITNELVPNQTIINDRTVVFKISSVSGTSILGDVIITDSDFSSSGITSGLAIPDNSYVNLTVTYNGSGSTDQTSVIINRIDGGNTLFFDILYDESAVVETTGEYGGFSCEKVDDTQPPVQVFKVLVNSGSTDNNYQTFYTNETPTITAETPPEGMEFYIWIGDTQYITSPTSPTTQITGVGSGSTINLTATYGVIRDVITTTSVHGGTITGGGKYQVGEIATLVATPDSNHYFSNWIGDVSYITSGSTTGNTIQITMPDHPITLSVVFSDYLVLTVNNGTISTPTPTPTMTLTPTPTPTMTLTPTPTPTITPTVIASPILSYDIDTTYATGNKYLELDFDNSAYSESEIGVITIDNGDNTSITSVYNDGYLSSQHDYLTSGVYNVNISTTGTKGYKPINLFMCYDWQNINSLDMSVLTNLYYVEVGQNKLSSIQLPNDHHKTWGFEFRFWDSIITNFSWPSFNYSGMTASDQLILSDLPNLSILDIPDSSKMATISLTNLPSITTINHSNVLIVDEYSPTSKCYYQLVNLPNLISLSLPEFNVNMASIRLNGISISGSLDLGITSSICNDLSISGVTNLTSLTFGNATDITTQWLNVIGTNVTTLDLSKFHINYSPTFYSQSQLGINNNPNLTTLINIGASTGNLISINISNNPNLGYVDFSNIGGISTSTITRVVLVNNNWSAAIINQVLVVLDSKTTSSSYGRIFSIGGNSAPDSTSGGYDGLAAKSSLQSKNITFA